MKRVLTDKEYRFGAEWVRSCRELACYSATMGPLCVLHAKLKEETRPATGETPANAIVYEIAGYLSTELLTVLSLSIIPVTLVVVGVARLAGMVAGV